MCVLGSKSAAGPEASGFPGQSILSDPMSNLAMAYGSSLATQGREMVDKNVRRAQKYVWCPCMQRTQILTGVCVCVFWFQLDRFIPISKLKYYFAVDTLYVGKKLGLVVFPYMHEVSLFLYLHSLI